MTETEWLSCEDPRKLLDQVGQHCPLTERKWACAMLVLAKYTGEKPDQVGLALIDTVEKYADGLIPRSTLDDHFEAAQRTASDGSSPVRFDYREAADYLHIALLTGGSPHLLTRGLHCVF